MRGYHREKCISNQPSSVPWPRATPAKRRQRPGGVLTRLIWPTPPLRGCYSRAPQRHSRSPSPSRFGASPRVVAMRPRLKLRRQEGGRGVENATATDYYYLASRKWTLSERLDGSFSYFVTQQGGISRFFQFISSMGNEEIPRKIHRVPFASVSKKTFGLSIFVLLKREPNKSPQ